MFADCCILTIQRRPVSDDHGWLKSTLATTGDFSQFYIGASLARTGAEYDIDRVLRLQQEVLGGYMPHVMPSRLPFYYGLLRPLSSFSFSSAHHIWLALAFLAAVSAMILLSFSQGEAAIAASLWSTPLFFATAGGQDVGFLYLVLAGGLWLRQSGRPASAGLLLSLLWIKFHLFLLLPILFLIKREFRLLAGALWGSAALLGVCFALAGRHWPANYAALLLNPILSPGAEIMPNLHGVASRIWDPAVAETILTVLAIVCAILVIARSQFEISLAAALLGGILISRHSYTSDCAVLVPAFLAVWRYGGSPAREIALICLIPFPYWLSETVHYGWIPGVLFLLILLALAHATPIRAGVRVPSVGTELLDPAQ
jgi:hypothetical protein